MALEGAGHHVEAVASWALIPDGARAGRAEVESSRLRAIARGASPAVAADAIETWLATHRDDREARELLVDVWERGGRPDLALRALEPLLRVDRNRWMRRGIELGRGTGRVEPSSHDSRPSPSEGAPPERSNGPWSNCSSNQATRTAPPTRWRGLRPAWVSATIERLPSRTGWPAPSAQDLILELLNRPACVNSAARLGRAIERTMAEERHALALDLTRRLPALVRRSRGSTRREGQLLLWTNDAPAAVALLGPIVCAPPRRSRRARNARGRAADDRPFLRRVGHRTTAPRVRHHRRRTPRDAGRAGARGRRSRVRSHHCSRGSSGPASRPRRTCSDDTPFPRGRGWRRGVQTRP